MLKDNSYFNVETTSVWNLALKQRWSWVDSKKQFFSYILMFKKLKSLYNVEMTTVFQRQNNVGLSTWNQRRNLTSKKRWVDHENIFVLML